ncbi:hypothetical protein [Methylotuvimicrobium sp. KM1]|uniref:hypothetical protein n=1 Tax=unclassified Methylotuvimicrobium TaxID=2822412 RepID=UPI00384B0031
MNKPISKNIVERVVIVPENKRLDFLYEHFRTPLFDQLVFRIADKVIKDYSGGYFEYCLLEDSKAAFLRLGSSEGFTLINPFTNVELENVDDTPTGLIVSLYALGLLIEDQGDRCHESLHDIFHDIRTAIIDYCDEVGRHDIFYCLVD